jgi:hypothetical protein
MKKVWHRIAVLLQYKHICYVSCPTEASFDFSPELLFILYLCEGNLYGLYGNIFCFIIMLLYIYAIVIVSMVSLLI